MFAGASTFNRPLNEWDVSAVTNMDYMFNDAKSFNNNSMTLSEWNIQNVSTCDQFRKGSMLKNDLVPKLKKYCSPGGR